MSGPTAQPLTVTDLGRCPYQRALELQLEAVETVIADPAEPLRLLLVEHDPPVITLGRAADRENILVSPKALAESGTELHETSRGGEVTWHGPGQLVGYPILRLDGRGRDLHRYLRDLEEAVIRVAGRFGLVGRRIAGLTGVWVGEEKIAAIGVAVRRWISYHGFALNVCCDLSAFEAIIPCGIRDRRPTSLAKLLGRDLSVEEVKPVVVECFTEVFGLAAGGVPRPCPSAGMGVPHATATPTPSPAPKSAGRLPPWLKRRLHVGEQSKAVSQLLSDLRLNTVCDGAHCPNRSECFSQGTATFLILGRQCTRGCRFCAIDGPDHPLPPPAADEPDRVAQAAERLGLRHVVITSVTRDDLADGGAGHFAATIRGVRNRLPTATIEVLVPDFQGDPAAVRTVLDARPDVFNHNVETVPRLYPLVRPQADYHRSLTVLRQAAGAGRRTKSGLMVGLGESDEEVLAVLRDLREVGCDIVTIGQYLAPSSAHLPVQRFVEPAQFEAWRRIGLELGLPAVASAPLVRSSYHAEQIFHDTPAR